MAAGGAAAPHSVAATLATAGRPLDPPVRSAMEARLGHWFGDVRIHADAQAARSAQDAHAQAYTVGWNRSRPKTT